MLEYHNFLQNKIRIADRLGFDIALDEINDALKPHQKIAVQWAISGGSRALFESFGLGKSIQQLEIVRLVLERLQREDGWQDPPPKRGLIVCPLGVRQEFIRDSIDILNWSQSPKFIKSTNDIECEQCAGSGEIESIKLVKDHENKWNLKTSTGLWHGQALYSYKVAVNKKAAA